MKKRIFTHEKMLKCLSFMLILLFTTFNLNSQSMNCGFDELFEANMSNGYTFNEIFYENEDSIISLLNQPVKMALINGPSNYTVPVVVHVMHLGEPEGVGSNIPDVQIIQAINDLNDDFNNTNGTGVDIGIQFCLAERTPDGQSTDGIVRVNAAGICAGQCYGSGMTVGGPLATAVKAASIWPNTDYVNIWVVHSIVGALGYATFPGSPSSIDGIVIDDNYFGIGGSNVLTHETGHFFNLFHTFQGDCPPGVNCNQNCVTSTICPPNNPCDNDPTNDMTEICCRTQGDRICDTPPHKRSCSDCNPIGTNICDNGSSNSLFVHNYMDYSELSCMTLFTEGQRTRMRHAFMDLRGELMNSLDCTPACFSAIASFDGLENGMEGETLCFINTSTGATDYNWQLNGESQSSSTDFCFDFITPGTYELCLTASNSNCTNKVCHQVVILWDANHCNFVLPECELLYNGDFSNVSPNGDFHTDEFIFNRVCNWYNRKSFPEFKVNNSLGNSWQFWYSYDWNEESIGTTTELDLVAGFEYNLSFEYSVLRPYGSDEFRLDAFHIGLSETLLEGNSNTILWEINEPINDFHSSTNSNIQTVHQVDTCFTYTGGMGRYLYVDGIPDPENGRILVIRNLSINSCTCSSPPCNPIPEISYLQDSCSIRFEAINSGDPGICYWDFGDGTNAEGCEVEHEYIFGGKFNVCLTIACDEYTQETVCDSIIVPLECEDCTELDLSAVAVKCDDEDTGSYMTKVDFEIPKGTKPCSDGLFVWSNDAYVSVTSFEIEEATATTDLVTACFNLTAYDGVNLQTQNTTVYITLCDSLGNMICYTFIVKAATCDNCLGEITTIATCIDDNPFDDIYLYKGGVTINLPPGDNYKECNPISTEVGYDQTVSIIGNQANIDFTINTSTEGDFDAATLLCFYNEEEMLQICYTLNIDINPCPPLPTDCVAVWATKPVNCTKSEDGMLTYNFAMGNGMIQAEPYEVCDFGVQGTIMDENDEPIEGAVVSVNYGYLLNGYFVFSVDFSVPCEFEGSYVILRLYFCDDRGNMVCYYFPLYLKPCHLDCEDRGDGEIKERSASNNDDTEVNIFPKPATNNITIQIKNAETKQQNVEIIDQLGRVLIEHKIASNAEFDISKFNSGLHFVKIANDDGSLIGIEKLLIIK